MSTAGQIVLAVLAAMRDFAVRSAELLVELMRPRRGIGMLVSFLLIVFLGAAFISTLEGVHQLAGTEGGSFNPVSYAVAGLVSLAVTLFMWVMLERARLPGSILTRLFCAALYAFALVWSFSFGYSFWWSAIASRADSTQSINKVVGDLGNGLDHAVNSVSTISGQLDALAGQSAQMAKLEDESGGTCGIPSGAGRQRLWQARRQVNVRIASEVDQIKTGWVADIGSKLAVIKNDRDTVLKTAEKLSSEERNRRFSEVYENAKSSAGAIGDTTGKSGPVTSDRLRALATELRQEPGTAKFTCYDPALAQSLDDIAKMIAKPIVIPIPPWAPVEGQHATAAASARLGGTMLAPVAGLLGLDPATVRMHGRDWIAFLAAVIIDLAIVALTLVRPRAGGQAFMADAEADRETMHRLGQLLRQHREPARRLLYDLHFSVGRRQYIALPDTAWRSAEELDSRALQLAAAALASRLSAHRCTNPSTDLVTHAVDRLRLAGWVPPEDTVEDPRTGFRARVRGVLKGSVQPNHPTIYRIRDVDRNEALRLMYEQEQAPTAPPRSERQSRHGSRYPVEHGRGSPRHEPQPAPVAVEEPPFAAADPAPVAVAAPAPADDPAPVAAATSGPSVDADWVRDVYAAAVAHRSQGFQADAENFLTIIRGHLPKLAAKGVEVLGLDDVAGRPFDAHAPFVQIGAEPSDLPRGVVLRVEELAFVQQDGSRRKVLKEGSVVVSAGPAVDEPSELVEEA